MTIADSQEEYNGVFKQDDVYKDKIQLRLNI